MSIKINFSNKNSGKSSANNVLFADEKFNINGLKKYLSSSEFSYINDLLKTSDLKKKYIRLRQNTRLEKKDLLFLFFLLQKSIIL